MIILSWNIRGLGSSDKHREVRNIVRRFKCDILIFYETKVESSSHSLLLNIRGGKLTQQETLPSHGALGGILIGWDDRIVTYVDTQVGLFSLSLKFRNILDNFEWWLTGVYGPCTSNLKSAFLDELRQLISSVGSNWMIGGNFRITRFSHEHSTRSGITSSMANFNDFIATAGLIDFSPNNCLYTWSNFQEHAIMVKLDRFLISPSWETQYPRSIYLGKFKAILDHIPICLDIIPPGWGPFPFKFYKSWFLLNGFDNLVKNCISAFVSSANPIDRLSYKLKEVKKTINAWIPNRTRNWSYRLQAIESSLQGNDIQAKSHPISTEVWHRKQELRRERHKVLLEQEVYWKQRSRVQWLKEEDLNTTFFHKVANGRKMFSTISSLLINDIHIDSPSTIRSSIEQYFFSLFNKHRYSLVNFDWDYLILRKFFDPSTLEVLFSEE